MLRRYVAGAAVDAILEDAGISKATFYRILRREGYTASRQARSFHSPEVLEMARRAHELRLERGRGRGGSKRLREIAADLRVTRSRVSQLLEIPVSTPRTPSSETRLTQDHIVSRADSKCLTQSGILPRGKSEVTG